jgi:hypothetical protein
LTIPFAISLAMNRRDASRPSSAASISSRMSGVTLF